MPRAPALALALLLAASLPAETEAEFAARAAALHARLFTIDTHVDTPTLSLARTNWDIAGRHDATDGSQLDFPRMRDGGLKAAGFAAYVAQGPRTAAGYAAARDSVLRSLLRVHEAAARYASQCALARGAGDAERIARDGKIVLLPTIENGYAIGQDLTLLKTYQELGVRVFGFVHNGHNDLADSSQPAQGQPVAEWHGLSPLGREAVAACNRLGLVVDGSHASDETVRQLLALSRTPVLLTHSGCKAVHEHKRNVDDELLRQLAAQGGVIQINTVEAFVAPRASPDPELSAARARIYGRLAGREVSDAESADTRAEYYGLRWRSPKPMPTLDDFLKHLFHAIAVAGVEHVGIGSDMDGGGGLAGLRDVSDYPKITLALLKHGLSEDDVAKIWGGNTLRVLRAAEEWAARGAERSPPTAEHRTPK